MPRRTGAHLGPHDIVTHFPQLGPLSPRRLLERLGAHGNSRRARPVGRSSRPMLQEGAQRSIEARLAAKAPRPEDRRHTLRVEPNETARAALRACPSFVGCGATQRSPPLCCSRVRSMGHLRPSQVRPPPIGR